MTINAQYFDDEFVTAAALNAGVAAESASLAALASGMFRVGLLNPDAASFSVSGLSVTASLPQPFATLFGSGVLSNAHGTTDGADTQSYTTDFSSFIPGSGSVTVYLLASYQSIQQNPFAIVGPPPGHPDFNPNFQPYTAYASQIDSLAVTASSGAADNNATFELFRAALTSGSAAITPDTSYQQRAASNNNLPPIQNSSTTPLPVVWAGTHIQLQGVGPYTLPTVANANGSVFTVSNTTTLRQIVTTDQTVDVPDVIKGTEPYPYLGEPAFYLEPGQYVRLVGADGFWQIIGGDPIVAVVVPGAWFPPVSATSGVFVVGSDCPPNVTTLKVATQGPAGGGASIFVSGGVYYTGGGGGAGGYSEGFITVFNGQNISWNLGTGGTGGTSGASGQAGTGTNTVFGTISASSGTGGMVYNLVGGVRSSAGGAGGVGSGGYRNVVGGSGGNGDDIGSSDGGRGAGYGGVGYLGGGGSWQSSPPGSTGAPGTGGPGVFGTVAYQGGTGRDGDILVTWGL
jgi:hypothetical protein